LFNYSLPSIISLWKEFPYFSGAYVHDMVFSSHDKIITEYNKATATLLVSPCNETLCSQMVVANDEPVPRKRADAPTGYHL